MTIHERMVSRTEREKDLLKYGRSQERKRIIKLLKSDPEKLIDAGGGLRAGYEIAIALIKKENNEQ